MSNFFIIGMYNFPMCLICIRSVCGIFYCMIKEYLVHMPVAITVMLSSNLIVNPIRKGRIGEKNKLE